MKLKKVKKICLGISGLLIFSIVSIPITAKAYNVGGDGTVRINSWDVNNFENSGDLWKQTRYNYDPEKVKNRVVSGDFTGKGVDDIVAFYDYGQARTEIHKFTNVNGTSYSNTLWDSRVGNFDASCIDNKVVSGDFDGNGIDEIATLYAYSNSTVSLFEFSLNSSGSAFSDKTVWKSGQFNGDRVKAMVAGDFDGDGKDEILIFYDYGNRYTGMFELKKNADGTFTDRYAWESTAFDSNAIKNKVVAGDFNGDRKDEVAMFYDYGDGTTKIWSLSNKNKVYSASETWFAESFDSSKISGKVTSTRNKNGEKDKIIALYDYSYLNNVTGIFTWSLQSDNKFLATKQKESQNYEAARVTGRVVAGKFDGKTTRLAAMYDSCVVNPPKPDEPKVVYIMEATAYYDDPITASGTKPVRDPNGWSTVAVDPNIIPLGTKLYIKGYGYAIAEDTGGVIKGYKIDLFMNSRQECNEFGRKNVEVQIL